MEVFEIETERLQLRQFRVEDARTYLRFSRMSRPRWIAAVIMPLMQWMRNMTV